jgi:hypothetical protein
MPTSPFDFVSRSAPLSTYSLRDAGAVLGASVTGGVVRRASDASAPAVALDGGSASTEGGVLVAVLMNPYGTTITLTFTQIHVDAYVNVFDGVGTAWPPLASLSASSIAGTLIVSSTSGAAMLNCVSRQLLSVVATLNVHIGICTQRFSLPIPSHPLAPYAVLCCMRCGRAVSCRYPDSSVPSKPPKLRHLVPGHGVDPVPIGHLQCYRKRHRRVAMHSLPCGAVHAHPRRYNVLRVPHGLSVLPPRRGGRRQLQQLRERV